MKVPAGADPVRMLLAGPSSLAELTAGKSLSEPLERSSWLMIELECSADGAGASRQPQSSHASSPMSPYLT